MVCFKIHRSVSIISNIPFSEYARRIVLSAHARYTEGKGKDAVVLVSQLHHSEGTSRCFLLSCQPPRGGQGPLVAPCGEVLVVR